MALFSNYFKQLQKLHYNTVWRWHFYAGLFCIPFVMILSISGAIYLFKPQVEAFQYRAFDDVSANGLAAKSAKAQVLAALAAVPNSDFSAYQLPNTVKSAAQVMLKKDETTFRVLVNPFNLQVLKIEHEDERLMNWIHRLHGQLLFGERGSNIVELAASWAIVMIITGLFLWWPRNSKGVAGILYPRLSGNVVIKDGKPIKTRLFWRDLHAVIGFWIAFFVLFLLISGLPWTKSWGGLLREIRQVNVASKTAQQQQDWTIGGKPVQASMTSDEHAQHQKENNAHQKSVVNSALNLDALDAMVVNVAALSLAQPVLIVAPSTRQPSWVAKSDAQNRPLRVTVDLNANTGEIRARKNFADKPFFDRLIGYGIAIHEGQLFGWLNQLLGLLTALGLITVSVSGTVMWWRKRQKNQLGAPISQSSSTVRLPLALVILALTFSILLPFLGLSLLIVLALERWVLPYFPQLAYFLNLQAKLKNS
jgi:uncharacterized iron-regulated membrane protein